MHARRFLLPMIAVLSLSSAGLASFDATAYASNGYVSSGSFGEPCSSEPCGDGQFKEPSGVAVNSSSESLVQPAAGDVYVIDSGDARVERFSSAGAYEAQFDGAETAAKSFSFTSENASAAIAVDSSSNPLDPSAGDVYVADVGHGVVDRFSSSGAYLGQLAGTCPSPGTCTAGETIPFPGELLGVAVDPSGNLWVYEANANVDEYSDTGAFLASFSSGRGPHPGLAVDSSESVYLIAGDTGVAKFQAGKEVVEFSEGAVALALDSSTESVLIDKGGSVELYGHHGEPYGKPLEVFATEGIAESQGIGVGATGIAYVTQRSAGNVEMFASVPLPTVVTAAASEVTETAATLHGTVNPEGEAIVACRFEYGTTTAYGQSVPCEQAPGAIGSGSEPVPVSARLSGLASVPARHLRLVASNANGTRYGNDIAIEQPGIEGEAASHVTSTEARVSARIAAHGETATYHVEYGTSEAYGSSTPELSVGAPEEAVSVTEQLLRLQPDAEYHYRFVASNAYGSNRGPDATFRTSMATGSAASLLPDERVYELVSTSSGPGEVYVPGTSIYAPQDSQTEELFQAAAGGDAVAYMADPGVTGGNGATGAGLGNEWLATRAPEGWATSDITPVGSSGRAEYEHFASDLSTGFVETSQQPPLTPDAPAGCQLLYSRASSSGAYGTLFTTTKTPGVCGNPHFAGESADGSQVLLQTEAALTEDALEAEPATGQESHSATGTGVDESCKFSCDLYVASGGRLRLVNVLPGGEADPNATFGGPSDLHKNGPDLSNAISTDGSRIFWTDTRPGPGFDHIYALENGTTNVQVSGAGTAHYWTASPDGRYVFYTEAEALWRFDSESNTREALVGEGLKGESPGVQGVIGTNDTGEDGAYVYLVATAVLANDENANGETAQAGEDNLYLRHGAATTFIAMLDPQDNELHAGNTCCGEQYGDWVANVGRRTSQVTPDGKQLVLESVRPLTGYDNENPVTGQRVNEAFVYAADTGRLSCASCSPTGEPPSVQAFGASLLLTGERDTDAPRWISEDGNHMFFDDFEPLVTQDTNGVQDVYEWDREGTGSCPVTTPARRNGGCVFLLSSGESSDYSYFVDTDANGENVFLTSRSQLVPQDRDEKTDLYDARVRGGFPTYPLACTGTGCQGVPPAAPIFATPASATFGGVGNFEPTPRATVKPKVKPAACRKGYARKHGKCVKRKVKRKVKKTKRSKKAGTPKNATSRHSQRRGK